MPNWHYTNKELVSEVDLSDMIARYVYKFAFFFKCGYYPHYWQTLFHSATNPDTDNLCRFRHLVAGRRGGKTLSAAWEVLFYILHPEVYHLDAHGEKSNRPLRVQILTKDYPTGMAALLTFREVLLQATNAGLINHNDYKENRGNRWFEFNNGAFLELKTADNPESLRGAGLDILWIDEAAFIPNSRSWEVIRPAMADRQGMVITTTTPDGKNWFYDEFWQGGAFEDNKQAHVEYRSIDNPYFPAEEWQYLKRTYHPQHFKQEFMAAFDSAAGKELSGDWLKYYQIDEILVDPTRPFSPSNIDLKVYIGVDPAISLADTADRFVITVLGVTKDKRQVYLLEQFAGRIPFPEQVDKINEFFQKWSPHFIGIEKTAYQAALAQQVNRLDGFPPVVPHWTKGKKSERILSMSPLFRIGKVKILREHLDFIDEWLDYDSTKSNPKDDCLDSMDITLRTAGVLLPGMIQQGGSRYNENDMSIEASRYRDSPSSQENLKGVDDHMGAEW